MKEVKYVVRRENNRCIIIIIDSSREEICTSIALFYPFTRECREILASIRFLARLNLPSPPLSLLSITMRKSLGEKVARTVEGWKAFEKRREIERPGIWESKIKKKERERQGQRHTVPVFSRHGWDPAIFARLRPVAMDHVGWYWITSNERVCPAQSSPRSSRTGSKLFSKPLPMLCQRTPLRWSCGNRW